MGEIARKERPFLRLVKAPMDEDRKRQLKLDTFLDAEADKRARGITLEALIIQLQEMKERHASTVAADQRWKETHENKDDARHGELLERVGEIETSLAGMKASFAHLDEDVDRAREFAEEAKEITGQYSLAAVEKKLEEVNAQKRELEERAEVARSRNSDRVHAKKETTRIEVWKWALGILTVVISLSLAAAFGRCSAAKAQPPMVKAAGGHS